MNQSLSTSFNTDNNNSPDINSNKIGELIRYIPIKRNVEFLIYEIVQTPDIFFIGFQPEYSEADISVYEFKNCEDLHCIVREELGNLILDERTRNDILNNIKDYANEIEDNIKFFGGAHFFDC